MIGYTSAENDSNTSLFFNNVYTSLTYSINGNSVKNGVNYTEGNYSIPILLVSEFDSTAPGLNDSEIAAL